MEAGGYQPRLGYSWQPVGQQLTTYAKDMSEPQTPDDVREARDNLRRVTEKEPASEDLRDYLASCDRDGLVALPKDWPRPLQFGARNLAPIPEAVQDRYNSGQARVCFCGLFPEIGYAWASLDSSLYLWRVGRTGERPMEYNSEDAPICAVGLARPRPGVQDGCSHVLVVCTTQDVALLFVTGGDATGSTPLDLQGLPLYTTSSDGVTMCSVGSTKAGRIFLGGVDGALYEVWYRAPNGELECGKRCHTDGVVKRFLGKTSLLRSLLPSSWLGDTSQPIMQIEIDETRNTLFARTPTGVKAFYLSSPDRAELVGEVQGVVEQAKRLEGAGLSRAAPSRTLAHIAPIGSNESSRIGVLAITVDGFTVVLGTRPSRGRPTCLHVSFVLEPIDHPSSPLHREQVPAEALLRSSGRSTVGAAAWCAGTLLVAKAVEPKAGEGPGGSVGGSGASELCPVLMWGRAPASIREVHHGAAATRAQVVAQMDAPLQGVAVAAATCPGRAPLDTLVLARAKSPTWRVSGGDLAAQCLLSRPKFLVMTSRVVAEVERWWPVDILEGILTASRGASHGEIGRFADKFGRDELAAMCYLLAAKGECSSVTLRACREVLLNAEIVGRPAMVLEPPRAAAPQPNLLGAGTPGEQALAAGAAAAAGQAAPQVTPQFSAVHEGLCLYLSRTLELLWDQPLFTSEPADPARPRDEQVFVCAPEVVAALPALHSRLANLARFLREMRELPGARRQRGAVATPDVDVRAAANGLGLGRDAMAPAAKRMRTGGDAWHAEDAAMRSLIALVMRCAEVLQLVEAIVESNLLREASKMDLAIIGEEIQRRPTLEALVCEPGGDELVRRLAVQAVNARGQPGAGNALRRRLQLSAPSFFGEAEQRCYDAGELLRRAADITDAVERENYIQRALDEMLKVPLSVDLRKQSQELFKLGHVGGIIELTLSAAESLYRGAVAKGGAGEASAGDQQLGDPRNACYEVVAALVCDRFRERDRRGFQKLLRAIADTRKRDARFADYVYGRLVERMASPELRGMDQEIISAGPPVDDFLRREARLDDSPAPQALAPFTQRQEACARLLADYYGLPPRCDHAARAFVLQQLALRQSGPEDMGLTTIAIERRIELLQQAINSAEASKHGCPREFLRWRRHLDVQHAILRKVDPRAAQGSHSEDGGRSPRAAARQLASPVDKTRLQELRTQVLDEGTLFNDWCEQEELWAEGLRIFALRDDYDVSTDLPQFAQTYWENFVFASWMGTERGGATPGERLAQVCREVAALGQMLEPGHFSFPVEHVAALLLHLADVVRDAVDLRDATASVARGLVRACERGGEGGEVATECYVLQVLEHLQDARPRDLCVEPYAVLHTMKHVIAQALQSGSPAGSRLRGEMEGWCRRCRAQVRRHLTGSDADDLVAGLTELEQDASGVAAGGFGTPMLLSRPFRS
ncbi:unnamed protein product [Pedinophyceae sp. YPF-701]|nr:unnamed protein product [Pedinophyceae sp. YPF-701]